jgi:sugar lactone lactonase YvrE
MLLAALTSLGSLGLPACSGARLHAGDDGIGGHGGGAGGQAGRDGGIAGAGAGAAGSIVPSGAGAAAGSTASGVGGNAGSGLTGAGGVVTTSAGAGGSARGGSTGSGGTAGSTGAGGTAGPAGSTGASGAGGGGGGAIFSNGLSVNPGSATFAATPVGATSAAQTFLVRNEGNGTSPTITALTSMLTGADATDFLITGDGCGQTLQPGASCQIAVALAPKIRSGSRNATLTFGSSSASVYVPLNGTALPSLGLLSGGLGVAGGGAARFSDPIGIASDGAGHVYVTDNGAVRQVLADTGDVTTIAGAVGQQGYYDGIGFGAAFNGPDGLASDGAGNLYVADTSNCTIRKVVVTTGEVTTLAGMAPASGYCGGFADGIGTAARFRYPDGIASDGAGNLYVADAGNNAIRKIVIATAEVTTLAGGAGGYDTGSVDGIGTAARFSTPTGVAYDGAGNLYIADVGNSTIRKIVIATAAVTTFAGTTGQVDNTDGRGTAAHFNEPESVAFDGGNLYVSDIGSITIRKIVVADKMVTTLAGTADQRGAVDGIGANALFSQPYGIASDGAGNLYVTDGDNHDIRKIVIATGAVSTLAGAPTQPGDADGTGTAAGLNNPAGVSGDGAGNVYVADSAHDSIRKLVIATGALTTLAGAGWPGSADGIAGEASFAAPTGVAADDAGNLFVTDTGNSTIRKIVIATGTVTTFAGTASQPGSADGTGGAAAFSSPAGIAADGAGNLYVADTANSTIRKVVIATAGVTTLAGTPGQLGSADGTGSAARFAYPTGIAADGGGSLYVTDAGNDTIRRIVIATGAVTTLAGVARQSGSADGTGAAARFNSPYGVATDQAGNLYVADTGNGTVRKIVIQTAAVSTLIGSPGQIGVATGAFPASLNTPYGVFVLSTGELAITDFYEDAVLIGHL